MAPEAGGRPARGGHPVGLRSECGGVCPGPHVIFAVEGVFLTGLGDRPHLVTAGICGARECLCLWESGAWLRESCRGRI